MKKYKYTVNCKNCGIDELVDQDYGKERPVKKTCNNCGCNADTTATQFNKNIDFKNVSYCPNPLSNPIYAIPKSLRECLEAI